MKVFISWSDNKSQAVAIALADWLPGVINSIEPFVSAKDIYAGTRWQRLLSRFLFHALLRVLVLGRHV